ncbi:MAG: hypothetical protein V2A73_13795 [Pseudomonadota bacterium]
MDFGYALALGKQIIVTGWNQALYHKLNVVRQVTWDISVATLAERVVNALRVENT